MKVAPYTPEELQRILAFKMPHVPVERTKAGLARARAQGKRLGHPRLEVGWKGHPRVDFARVHALRAQGMSYRVIAKQLGVSHQTVKNRLRNEGGNPPNEKNESGGT